jgi:hypothetical protein
MMVGPLGWLHVAVMHMLTIVAPGGWRSQTGLEVFIAIVMLKEKRSSYKEIAVSKVTRAGRKPISNYPFRYP